MPMPPAVVKTVGDLIFWQYAKIIADSAGIRKTDYGFVMKKFKQLRAGSISWNEIREYVKERETVDRCGFCGATADLTLEHLLRRSTMVRTLKRTLFGYAKAAIHRRGQGDFTSTLLRWRMLRRRSMMCPA
jgi:hypothetical protein